MLRMYLIQNWFNPSDEGIEDAIYDNYAMHGMKVHSGVDAGRGYVHAITKTAANDLDIDETAKFIREDVDVVYGDSGYSGAEKREETLSDEHL